MWYRNLQSFSRISFEQMVWNTERNKPGINNFFFLLEINLQRSRSVHCETPSAQDLIHILFSQHFYVSFSIAEITNHYKIQIKSSGGNQEIHRNKFLNCEWLNFFKLKKTSVQLLKPINSHMIRTEYLEN